MKVLSRLVDLLLVPLWKECLVSNVPVCLCVVSEGQNEVVASF